MPARKKSKTKPVASDTAKVERSILELFGLFSLGFLVFLVLFVQAGFIFGFTITNVTLPLGLIAYSTLLIGLFLTVKQIKVYKTGYFVSLCLFLSMLVFMAFVSIQHFSQTYDTSWDGQGYHSNGIIALSNSWNPLYQKELPVEFLDAAIFVQGYPKAVWIVESLINSATGFFNAGKVINLYVIVVAFVFAFAFLRKVRVPLILSGLLSLIAVLQPPFIIQINTFQLDLFSYEMTLIAVSALGLLAVGEKAKRYVFLFVMAALFLLGSKFSNLPVVAVLGIIFLFILFAGNAKVKSITTLLPQLPVIVFCTILFLLTPYGTNVLYFGHPFYPSNLDGVSQTYRQDNVPQNLQNAHRGELLFYGLFSRSQVKPMGNDDPMNIAELKLPFTFTYEEVMQSASIYNNRVGSAGPLYSGIIVLTILLILYLFEAPKQYRPHALAAVGLVVVCILVTLLSPASNMLRYNVQLVFIPFIPLVAALLFTQNSVPARVLTYVTVVALLINTALFTVASVNQRNEENRRVTAQLQSFKDANTEHKVWAQNFYSNYIRFDEYSIPYTKSNNIDCDPIFLEYTFYTTKVCPR